MTNGATWRASSSTEPNSLEPGRPASGRMEPADRPTVWLWTFWALIWCAGWSVLELLSGETRVASAFYGPRPWLMPAAIGAVVWSAFCLAAALIDRSRSDASAPSGAATARRRTLALLPVIPVFVFAAIKHFFEATTFAVMPVSGALLGWSVGRWACLGLHARAGAGDTGSHTLGDTSDRAGDRSITTTRGWAVVGMACVGFAVYWFFSLESFRRAGNLGFVDIGLFAARLLNTARWTFPFREHAQATPFDDHFNPGFYLLVPLVYFVDVVKLLHAAGALACVAPALVWYANALRAGWSTRWAIAVAMGWLMLPGLSHAMLANTLGFHPVLLALPCIAGSLLMMRQGRWLGFAALAVLACSFRETVTLAYLGVGIWLAMSKRTRRAGVTTAIVAAGYLIVVILLIIPAFRGGEAYLAGERFSHLGDSMFEVLASPITRPGAFWSSVVSHESLMLCLALACGVGLWPLMRIGKRWIVLLPEGVFLLLWQEPMMRSIAYHYHAVLLVLLYWACIDGISDDDRNTSRTKAHGVQRNRSSRLSLATVVASSFFGSVLLGWWPQWHDTTPFDFHLSRADDMRWIASHIDPGDTAAVTQRAGLHCLAARSIRMLPDVDMIAVAKPDVCVLEYTDEWGRFALSPFLRDMWNCQRALMAAGYVATDKRDAAVVYRRAGAPDDSRSVIALADPFVEEIPLADRLSPLVALTRELSIAGIAVVRRRDVEGPGDLRCRLYLAIMDDVPTDYGIAVSLRTRDNPNGGDLSFAPVRPAGGMTLPSSEWQPGRIVVDDFHLPWVVPFEPDLQQLLPVVHLYDLRDGRLAVARMVDPMR